MADNDAAHFERTSLDPTALTTDQIRREIASMREILDARFTAVGARLDAMDKATTLLNDNITRFPTEVDKQVSRLQELTEQRFDGIDTQFNERDVRSRAEQAAAQVAVAVGLQAQKESAASTQANNTAAITKSETSTTKEIDAIKALLTSNKTASDLRIDDLRRTVDKTDGKDAGHVTANTERAASQASMLAVVSLIVAVVVGGASLLSNFSRGSVPQALSVQPPVTLNAH